MIYVDKCVPAVVNVLQRLDASLQVLICKILMDSGNEHFLEFAKSNLLSVLAMEAKPLVINRIFAVDDLSFMNFVNPASICTDARICTDASICTDAPTPIRRQECSVAVS